MENGSILITGCGSGLGHHWLKLLIKRGHSVIGLTRNPEAMEEDIKNSPNLTLVKCSLGSSKDIKGIKKSLLSRVEILINNAGFGQVGPIALQSRQDIQQQFEVNLFGLVELTNHLIPYMKSYSNPKVIMIGSSGGTITSPFNGAYSASKHALEAITDAYRFELNPLGIQTCCIQLGKLLTPYNSRAKEVASSFLADLGKESSTNLQKESLTDLQKESPKAWREGMASFIDALDQTDGQDVQTLDKLFLSLLEAKQLKSRYVWDNYTRLLFLVKRVLPRSVYEWLIFKKNSVFNEIEEKNK